MRLPVSKWSLFVPASDVIPFNMPMIEPLIRRRLSNLAKMALIVAYDCSGHLSEVNTIVASRNGEICGTVKMLHCLSHRRPLSPTAFSLSVHNAIAGLFSIIRSDRSPATAISAGNDTFFAALQEAIGQLNKHPNKPLLLIYVDEILPTDLERFRNSADISHSFGLLFDASTPIKNYLFEWEIRDGEMDTGNPAIAFAEFLKRGSKHFCWNGQRHTWRLSLDD